MKWNREQTEKYFVLFGKIMLVAAIVFNAWLTHKCYFNFLLSDDASELVYSRMLAQEGSIISSNWYGSTELEILNTQLIYSLLFHFTSNFQVVRIVGQVILTLIFLASYLFCLRGIDPEKAGERFWKTAFLLVIPISVLYTGCGSELCGAGAGVQDQKRRSFKEKKTCTFGNRLHLCFCGMPGRSPAYTADVSAACLKLCVDLVEPAGREWMDREKTVAAKRDNRKCLLACLWHGRLSGKCSVAQQDLSI